MSVTFRTQGIVISMRDLFEHDRIYSVLTAEHGKLELRARGSRKISSKLSSHLEPFALCDLMVVRGRYGDLVAGVERLESYRSIRQDMDKLELAWHTLSLVEMSTRARLHDPILFEEVRRWLTFIDAVPELSRDRLAFLSGSFTLKLLAILGFRPELLSCVNCERGIAPMGYSWHGLKGGVVCRDCCSREPEQWFSARRIDDNSLKLIRYAMSEHFEHLLDVRLPGPVLSEYHAVIESLVVAHFPVIPTVAFSRAIA
jgi:DNA repair protein RecO (recombination protein O)